MYLIKTVDKNICPFGLDETTESMMIRCVEYGVLPGSSLVFVFTTTICILQLMLEQILKQVYAPLFDPETGDESEQIMFVNLGETVCIYFYCFTKFRFATNLLRIFINSFLKYLMRSSK